MRARSARRSVAGLLAVGLAALAVTTGPHAVVKPGAVQPRAAHEAPTGGPATALAPMASTWTADPAGAWPVGDGHPVRAEADVVRRAEGLAHRLGFPEVDVTVARLDHAYGVTDTVPGPPYRVELDAAATRWTDGYLDSVMAHELGHVAQLMHGWLTGNPTLPARERRLFGRGGVDPVEQMASAIGSCMIPGFIVLHPDEHVPVAALGEQADAAGRILTEVGIPTDCAPGDTAVLTAAQRLAETWGVPGVRFEIDHRIDVPGGSVDPADPDTVNLRGLDGLQGELAFAFVVAHELAHVAQLRARAEGVPLHLAEFSSAAHWGDGPPPTRELEADTMALCLTGMAEVPPDTGYLADAPTTAQRAAAGAIWDATGVNTPCAGTD